MTGSEKRTATITLNEEEWRIVENLADKVFGGDWDRLATYGVQCLAMSAIYFSNNPELLEVDGMEDLYDFVTKRTGINHG